MRDEVGIAVGVMRAVRGVMDVVEVW